MEVWGGVSKYHVIACWQDYFILLSIRLRYSRIRCAFFQPTEDVDVQVMVNPLSNGTNEQPPDGTYVVPRPRFYNCPQGELLTLELPPGASQVNISRFLTSFLH